MPSSIRLTLPALILFSISTISQAALIIAPISVSVTDTAGTPIPHDFRTSEDNLINQSGFSTRYVSGRTDFVTFTSTATQGHALANIFRSNNIPFPFDAQITLGLGPMHRVDQLALWTSQSTEALTSFTLYSDSDDNFGNGTLANLGTFSSVNTNSAQIYSFTLTSAPFIHIDILDSLNSSNFNVNEVAFGGALPSPPTLALLMLGFGLIGYRAAKHTT